MLQARLWRKLIRMWVWYAGLRLRPLLCRVAHRAVRSAHATAAFSTASIAPSQTTNHAAIFTTVCSAVNTTTTATG